MDYVWRVIELKACAADDAERVGTAAILAAYLEAQRACGFRRVLWRRLAVGACLTWVVESTRILPPAGLAVALALFTAAGVGAGVAERRARKTLDTLIDGETRASAMPQRAQDPLRRMRDRAEADRARR